VALRKARPAKPTQAPGSAADFKHAAGVLMPLVDINRCEGKGPCVAVCPVDVFKLGVLPPPLRAQTSLMGRLKGFAHGWKQVSVQNPDNCRGCGLCVSACPESAITLVRNPSNQKR
jgi:4Fe-4S ferredoxin